MEYTARWGPKGFLVSPTKIVPLTGLTTSLAMKTDNGIDTSGTAPTNTRGRELQTINFTVTYVRAAGVDPRAQWESWDAELGNSYPLYIGEKRFGPEKMTLKKVDISDLQLSANGAFLSATLMVSLEEYSDGKSSKLTSSGSGSTGGDDTADKARQAYLDAKEKAMKSYPTPEEKKKLLPITGGD